MKIWLGGEIEPHVIDIFRPIRNWVEQNINNYLEQNKLSLEIEKVRILLVMRENPVKQSFKYNKKKKTVNLDIYIEPRLFLSFTEMEQRKLIFDNIIIAANWMSKELETSFDVLKDLLEKFREEYIMPPIVAKSLESIKEKFSHIKSTGIDITVPLRWSFYFIHNDKIELLDMLSELEGHTYETSLDSIENRADYWLLKLSKFEVLEVNKLNRRNILFKELADYYSIQYDGWEVEVSEIN